jgi:hypothetical protein
MENSSIRHFLYQFGAEGKTLHVVDFDEILEVNKQIAAEVGISSTLLRKSPGNLKANKELGRSFRVLWW